MTIEIRAATPEEMREHTGATRTVRALVVMRDGVLMAVAGVYLDLDRWVMFSNVKPSLWKDRRTIIRAYRMLQNWVRHRGIRVHATQQTGSTAEAALLLHLGFRNLGPVWEWLP